MDLASFLRNMNNAFLPLIHLLILAVSEEEGVKKEEFFAHPWA